MNPTTDSFSDAETDFRQTQSDLLREIKIEIIELNRVLTDAETEQRFGRGARTTSNYSVADVYRALSLLLKSVREVIPAEDVSGIDTWLRGVDGKTDRDKFLENAILYSSKIQATLFKLGIKDTNIKKSVKYEMEAYMEML